MKKLHRNPVIFGRLALLLGSVAIGAAAGVALMGCDVTVGNTKPRTLVITDINEEQAFQGRSGIIGIFQRGTSLQQAGARTGIVAASRDNITLSGEALAVPLYSALSDYGDEWTDTGSYDIYFIFDDENNPSYYRKKNVRFSSASTDVSAREFFWVSPEDDENTGGAGADTKTLLITGITGEQVIQGQSGVEIGIFPSGTSPQEAVSLGGIVAASGGNATFQGGTLTVPLYSAPAFEDGWTGSGNCDIYLMLGSGGNVNFFQKQDVSFSSASTRLSLPGFSPVSPPENTDAKTLIITDIGPDQASHGQFGFRVGIFPVGTTPEEANSQEGIVAGEGVNKAKSSETILTVDLYSASDFTDRWIGSGIYDVYLTLSYGSIETSYYRRNVPFMSASTTVSAGSFLQL
jgi:hypothetical protein